jgi:hypothetical protein
MVGLCNVFELLDDLLGISCICLINLMIKYDLHCFAMMSRTNEPMEGVVFDVQDHARRTGARGSVHVGR